MKIYTDSAFGRDSCFWDILMYVACRAGSGGTHIRSLLGARTRFPHGTGTPPMNFLEHEPLASHTTFRTGGAARFFALAATLPQVREALAFAAIKKIPLFVLGGGSNVLVDDAGVPGLVLQIALRGLSFTERQEGIVAEAAAGEVWDELVAESVARGLWGLENLSGIPGTVGGAPLQNIGAYGAELADTLLYIEALDRETGALVRFNKDECSFGYRTSRFKARDAGRYIITAVGLLLSRTPRPRLAYRDLAEAFAGRTPSLEEIREAVLAIRAKKFPDLSREGTAGSFFKNPVLPRRAADALSEKFPDIPRFDTPDGVKIPLAWILDKALHLRGAREGKVRAFERQPLVIVAEPGATSGEVWKFAEGIANRVRAETGIELQPEVVRMP